MNPVSEPVTRIPWRYKSTTYYTPDTDVLADYFRKILETKDFVATVYGVKDVGKSQSTIELCRRICPQFKLEEDLVFTLGDFYDVMENGAPKQWRVKILDDFGSELDPTDGMFDPARHASQYWQTSRLYKTGYFITTPNKKFINKDTRDRIADYFIELKTKNEGIYSQGVINHIEYNNRLDKNYFHSLCLGPDERLNNRGWGTKVWSYLFYPPPSDIVEQYIPLRKLKGQMNLDKGRADFKKNIKDNKSVEQVVEEVFNNLGSFSHKTKQGKTILDRGMIAYKFNLDANNMIKVMSLARQKLREPEEGTI
jgi:hypothetical protein